MQIFDQAVIALLALMILVLLVGMITALFNSHHKSHYPKAKKKAQA